MLFVASLLTSAGLFVGMEVIAEPVANGRPSAAGSGMKLGADGAARTPVWPHDGQREAAIDRHVDARIAAAEKALPDDSGTGRRAVFSITITAVSPIIQMRLLTPVTTITSISAQQQPRQDMPCRSPSRQAPAAPRR